MMRRVRSVTLVTITIALVFALGIVIGTEAQSDQRLEPLPAGDEYQASSAEQELAGVYDSVIQSVVNITVAKDAAVGATGAGTGSGFVIDTDGHIVTNNHVVEGASFIEVTFIDGSRAEAELVGRDPDSDLAVIRVDPDEVTLQPVVLADSDSVFVGQRALAIGSPFNQDFTLTTGIVSALNRNLTTEERFSIPHIIQTDTAINPGNSGGPLLNLSGQVMGVNTAILSGSGTGSGVGFAVPSNTVRRIAPYLIENGEYQHVWLGITGTTLIEAQRQEMGLMSGIDGIVVADVVPEGPAAQAGVQGSGETIETPTGVYPVGGDVITSIDGEPIAQMNGLIGYLESNVRPGETIELGIIRNGDEQSISVTLQARPDIPER